MGGVPGFIQMESRGGKGQYPDVSCCDALKLSIMSKDDYAGYRVAFGTERSKTGFFAMGHKGNIDDVPVGEFGDVIIPFNMFSVEWDEATGDQIVTCAEDPSVCPSESVLQNMETIQFGAKVSEVKSNYKSNQLVLSDAVVMVRYNSRRPVKIFHQEQTKRSKNGRPRTMH